MNIDDMLDSLVNRITNPSLTIHQKIRYAANELKCMALVASKWGTGLEEVMNIVQRIEKEDDTEMWEPERGMQDDDHKIFWDFVTEMEPFDLREWGLE